MQQSTKKCNNQEGINQENNCVNLNQESNKDNNSLKNNTLNNENESEKYYIKKSIQETQEGNNSSPSGIKNPINNSKNSNQNQNQNIDEFNQINNPADRGNNPNERNEQPSSSNKMDINNNNNMSINKNTNDHNNNQLTSGNNNSNDNQYINNNNNNINSKISQKSTHNDNDNNNNNNYNNNGTNQNYNLNNHTKESIQQNYSNNDNNNLNGSNRNILNNNSNHNNNSNNQQNNNINNYNDNNQDKNFNYNAKISNNRNNADNADNENRETLRAFNAQSNSNHSNASTIRKTGLVNLGDTSYLNAVLQLLGNIKNLANYFLVDENQKMLNENIKYKPLSFVIYRLFTHLYPKEENKGEKYKPDALKKMLGYLNIVYKSDKKRDPNDLLNFILDTLHQELNTKNLNNAKITPDLNDKDKFIKTEITNFNISNDSVISNSFNLFVIKECKCSQCNKAMYNLNSFNTFELDISGCYQLKKKQITLNDCLNYYCEKKYRNLFCNNCKRKSNMSIASDICNVRDILIFSLNRGNLKENLLNIPFNLEYMVDLKSFITNSNSPKIYDLIGIVSVYKKEQNYNYVAFCKSDNHWFLFEDEKINEIRLDFILSWHNTHNYIPCILAYQVIGTQ